MLRGLGRCNGGRIYYRHLASMSKIPRAPPDRILGLTEQFVRDGNPHKVNLTVGVYKDSKGCVTTLPSVARAQQKIIKNEKTYQDLAYLPIIGSDKYRDTVLDFLFKESAPLHGDRLLQDDRIAFVQTLSGTGALAVASKLLSTFISKTVWLPDPSWANHVNIFTGNGFTSVKTYPYYKNATITVDGWLQFLQDSVKQSTEHQQCILLHACCHNPTGRDPTRAEWKKIIQTINDLKLVPIIDMAYQGLETGSPIQDAYVLRECLQYKSWESGLYLCQSFAKNMGLYGERVGSLSIVLPESSQQIKENVDSQLKKIVRGLYSSPPGYGSRIVSTVLADADLRSQWYSDVSNMTQRLLNIRQKLFKRLGWNDLVDYNQVHGMFYYTNLSVMQVNELRKKYSVYLTLDGRLSISGVNDSNIDYVCDALKTISSSIV